MTIVLIGLAVAAAIVTLGSGIFAVAVVNAIASVWANGVMANFRDDPQSAPNAAATVSMATTAAAVVLIMVGLIIR